MTDTGDRRPHKPSPKHTLEEVRKSLEDLVRNEFDGAREGRQPADAGAATGAGPKPATPSSKRPARHGHSGQALDTGELMESLKDLLGDELTDTGQQADVAAGPHAVVPANMDEDNSRPSAQQQSATEPEPSADTPPPPPTDDGKSIPADDEKAAVSSPEPDELTHEAGSGSTLDTATGGEPEEITLEALAAQPPSDEKADVPAPADDAGPAVPDTMGADLARAPEPSAGEVDTAALEREMSAGADAQPSASTVPDTPGPATAGKPRAASEPGDSGVLEVIELPSVGGQQEVFAFEDPALGLAIRARDVRLGPDGPDTPHTESASPDATHSAEAGETARQDAESGLILEEEVVSLADDAPQDDQPIFDNAHEITLDAPDLFDSGPAMGKGAATPQASASDVGVSSEPGSSGTSVAATTRRAADEPVVMDVLQIPGGDELSEEITQEQPTPFTGDTVAQDGDVVSEPTHESASADTHAPDLEAEELSGPDSDAEPQVGTTPAAQKDAPRREPQVVATVARDDAAALSMPGVEFDVNDQAGGGDEDAPSVAPATDSAQTPLALADGGPLLDGGQAPQPGDAHFGELATPAAEPPSPPRKSELTIGDAFDLAGDDELGPATFGSNVPGESPATNIKPAANDAVKPSLRAKGGRPKPAASDAERKRPSDAGPAGDEDTRGPARRSKAGPETIPVLDEVVEPPARGVAAEHEPISPGTRADKTTARKPRRPRKSPRAAARADAVSRKLAVQVVAKLNMELRKCGERVLSPATIDRLQYLLNEALAQPRTNVDNSRAQKNKD